MTFGDNLRDLREMHGYSQLELSKMVGVSAVAISQYEIGSRAPTVFVAVKLARILGTTVEELVTAKE